MNNDSRHLDPLPEHDLDSLREIVALAVETARKNGASASEAALSRSAGLDVNVRLGEVETIEHTRDNSLGVTVYFGHSKGSASSTDFGAAAARASDFRSRPTREARRFCRRSRLMTFRASEAGIEEEALRTR